MAHLRRPRTHSENREVVCGVCYRKSKDLRKITPLHLSQLTTLVDSSYSLDDSRFQTVLCKSCVLALAANSKTNEKPERGRKILKPAYKNLTPPPAHDTRRTEALPCPCTVCDIARQTIYPGHQPVHMLEKHWTIIFPDLPYPNAKVESISVTWLLNKKILDLTALC